MFEFNKFWYSVRSLIKIMKATDNRQQSILICSKTADEMQAEHFYSLKILLTLHAFTIVRHCDHCLLLLSAFSFVQSPIEYLFNIKYLIDDKDDSNDTCTAMKLN